MMIATIRGQMKLRILREHYQNNKSSKGFGTPIWIPKRSFNTIEEVREAGFSPRKWHTYKCGVCGNFHTTDLKSRESKLK